MMLHTLPANTQSSLDKDITHPLRNVERVSTVSTEIAPETEYERIVGHIKATPRKCPMKKLALVSVGSVAKISHPVNIEVRERAA